ncbi:MAG: hypothetical protein HWD59_08165 [Coxiellaceae bacterium]|nr:MAG: hypothetical protein HWD59_08165 [Coxiellaceae bacterium]
MNQLLLPEQNSINENDVLLLLQHPVALATWTVDLCLSPDDARFPLAFSLLATQYLAGSAQGKPLFDQFQDTLATQLTPENVNKLLKIFVEAIVCRCHSMQPKNG